MNFRHTIMLIPTPSNEKLFDAVNAAKVRKNKWIFKITENRFDGRKLISWIKVVYLP